MSKKLISLVLVLAIASMASAGQWAAAAPSASQPAGNWNVGTNWDTGVVPVATDATVKLQRNAGDNTSNIIVTTAVSGGVKTQITSFTAKLVKLEITNTGSLSHSGSFDGYTGSLDATIDAGGVWNACTASGSFKMASNTAAGMANSVVVSVYGTLNVKGASGTLALVNDTRSGTSGTNTATVNIMAGGLVDVDSYIIGLGGVQYGNGHINFYGNGKMIIKGDARAQAETDRAAGRITGLSASDINLVGGNTVLQVPEPATLALLGLGGLTLLRRKR